VNADPEQNQEKFPVPPLAEGLQLLVEILYPEPGVVDILTLDQFIFRYKFSGLGATAVADMERAQRITRSVGDHDQIGLAEFHIGLIDLHWGQFWGAIKYFEDAHRHWQFAKHDPAVSLAQFAQGICQHHAYHYEQSLANYGKVQRILTKIESNGAPPPAEFLPEIKSKLDACREDVVQKIRTLGEGEPTMFRVPIQEMEPPVTITSDDLATKEETTVSSSPITPSHYSDRASGMPSAPLPISHLPPVAGSESQINQENVVDELETVGDAGPVISDKSPIPQHINQSDALVWYHVAAREEFEEFLPAILADTVLLVDTRTDLYICDEGDLVIVNQADAEGSIPLKPQQEVPERPFTRIYLAEVDEQLSFIRDPETGEIQFRSNNAEEVGKVKITANQADFPIFAEEIIGIVIGIWAKLHPVQRDKG